MRDGLELVLRLAFTTLRLYGVEANIQPTKSRSLALAPGAGFLREGFSPWYLKIGGRWRDHERWGPSPTIGTRTGLQADELT